MTPLEAARANLTQLEGLLGSDALHEAGQAELLRARAERYARLGARERERQGNSLLLVPFAVGEETLALRPRDVVSVRSEVAPRSALPLAPPWIAGVTTHAGRPVLILALQAIQGQAVPAFAAECSLVIVHWRKGYVALLSERVSPLRALDPAELQGCDDHRWLEPDARDGVLGDGTVVLALPGLAAQLDRIRPHRRGRSHGLA